MASLKDLAKNMYDLAASLDKKASDAAVKTAEAILEDLVYVTPVDTSKALSNWQVTTGLRRTLLSGAIPPYYPGKHGSTYQQSAAAALEEGKKVLQSKKPGDRILISNVLPYIRRLNDGWSAQTPAGFVERAVLLGRKVLERLNSA